MDVSGTTVLLKDCYFYLLYKRKGDEQTQIPILLDKTYDSATDTISASFEPTSYFTEKNGGLDIQVFACSTEQDFISEDVDIEDVALWTSFNAQISIAKSQLKDSQTIVAEDMFTKGIAEMSAYLEAGSEEADAAEEYASDAEEFARGTRSDGLTVPHASTGAHDNAKDYKDLAKDWASKIGGTVESGEYSAKYYAAVADTRSQEAEAYALGTKGGTPVPTFADKNAKDWATKTGTTVDGTNYSSKQYALNAKASADIVAEHATAIDSIYADLTNIDAVATDIQDEDSIINTVAENIQDVNAVAESITDVNTVAGKTTQITTVAGIASDVITVAGIDSDVTAVAGIASDVSAVEDIKTDVSAVAAIDTDVSAVSAIKDDVSAVATIDDDVTTVATDISDVSAVASDITKVTAVADDLTNIDAVADDLTNIDNAEANALKAEGWANGTQNGTPVSSDSPYYENNAKYWADAVPDLKDAIQGNTARIENLEQEHGGYYETIPPTYPNYAKSPFVIPTGKAKNWALNVLRGVTRVENQLLYDNYSNFSWNIDNSAGSSAIYASKEMFFETNYRLNANHSYLIFFTGSKTITGDAGLYCNVANNQARFFTFGSYDAKVLSFTVNNPNARVSFLTIVNAGAKVIMDGSFATIDLNTYFNTTDLSFLGATDSAKLATIQTNYPELLVPSDYGQSLVSTTYSGIESDGFNKVDPRKDKENYWYDVSTGVAEYQSGRKINEGFIPCTAGDSWYFGVFIDGVPAGNNFALEIIWYRSDKSYHSAKHNGANNAVLSVPSNVAYFRVGAVLSSYDVMAVKSSSELTEFHPHVLDTLTLPSPVTLRSAGSVPEEYDLESGEVTRNVKQADITLANNDSFHYTNVWFFTFQKPTDYVGYNSYETPSAMKTRLTFPKYEIGRTNVDDASNIGKICGDILPSSFTIGFAPNTTLAQAQEAFNGKFNYALATPDAPTQLDPIQNPYLATESGGTISSILTEAVDDSMTLGYINL